MVNIAFFDKIKFRRHCYEIKELWRFSVIDIVQVLTGQLF